jgi:beta-lactamase regulating signal transducer with metallopeptidase domain/HEAT repeat protein
MNLMNAALDFLNQAGAAFTGFASSMLVQSSLVILALLLLDRLIRNRARATVRHAIWLLALVKLVIPPSLSLPTGIGYWVRPGERQSPLVATLPPVEPARSHDWAESPPLWALPDLEVASAPPMPDENGIGISPLLSSPRPVPGIHAWLFLFWLAGMAALSGCLARNFLRLRTLLRQSREAPTSLLDELEKSRRRLGLRSSCAIRLSDEVAAPLVCRWWSPVIVMPAGLAPLEPARMRAIFLHELGHVKRGDLWLNWAQTLLQIFYFYHPLLWVANARVRRAREEAVDELVLVALGKAAADYPETLLHVARHSLDQPSLLFASTGIFETKSRLSQRIRQMLERPIPQSARLGPSGAAAILLLGAMLLPMEARSQASKPSSARKQDSSSNASTPPGDRGEEREQIAPRSQNHTFSGETQEKHRQARRQRAAELFNEFLAIPNHHLSGLEECRIMDALWELGEDAVHALSQALRKGELDLDRGETHARRRWASYLLGQMGPAMTNAIPELITALEDERIISRFAATALGHAGPPAREAVPALIEALYFGNGDAASALVKIAPDDPRLTPSFLEALEMFRGMDYGQSQDKIVMALGRVGPRAKPAIPQLLEMLEEENRRVAAAIALRSIARDSPEVIATAEATLRRIGPPHLEDADLPSLLRRLQGPAVSHEQTQVLWIISQMARESPEVFAALEKVMEQAEGQLKLQISQTLFHLGGNADRLLTLGMDYLRSPEPNVRSLAARTLALLETNAIPARPLLVELLSKDEHSSVRISAAIALGRIRPQDEASINALIAALDHPVSSLRYSATRALGNIGPGAKAAVPSLQRLLNDRHAGTRFYAMQALWRIDRQAPPLPELLLHLTPDSIEVLRHDLLVILGEMGPVAHEAGPAVRELMNDLHPPVREQAAKTMALIKLD